MKGMIDISVFSHGDMITRFNSPCFVSQVFHQQPCIY